MAKDIEIEKIEAMERELNVNPYTIKYDPKVKRFFKGFAPKLVSGALLSTALFAVAGIATVATGGIAGVGIGAIASASVGLGAGIQATYNGVVYSKNASKARFKAIGVGGKEDNMGAIGIVEECEAIACKYAQLLEAHPSKKEFTLEDGATYSRRDLKRRIKENEDIAYHGLKYILEQGVEISEDINALRNKVNLTQLEEDKLEISWDIMTRIGACVEKVSTSRDNFNPYKVLVADAILKGCLLGNDYQNNLIRAVAERGKKEKAFDVYSTMYEQKVLRQIKKERQTVLEQEQLLEQDKQQFVDTKKEVIAKDRQIDKVKRNNRKLAKEINELDSYSLLIDVASRLVVSLPQPMAKDRKNLGKAISEFKTAIEINDANEIKTKKDALDSIVEDVEDRIIEWYFTVGKKEGLTQFQEDFDKYKSLSQQTIARRTQQRDEAIQRGWNQRKQNQQLRQEVEFLETDLDKAQQGWYEAEGRAEKARKQASKAKRQVKKVTAERDYMRKRAEDAEDTVTALYNNFTQTEQDLQFAQQDLENETQAHYDAEKRVDRARKQAVKAKKQARTATEKLAEVEQQRDEANVALLQAEKGAEKTFNELSKANKKNGLLSRMVDSLLAHKKANEETIERLQEDVEHSRDVAYNENRARKQAEEETEYAQGVAYDEHVGRTGADDARAREVKAHKETKSKLSKETKRADKAETELVKANETIGNLGEELNVVREANLHNFDEILELQHKNKDLQAENSKLAKEHRETKELATQLGSDLHKVAKELEHITGERDSYVEAYNSAKETIEAKEDEIVDIESKYQTRFYNMLWQGAYNRLDKIVKKAETHARITAIEREHVDSCVDAVLGYVETVRKQHLEAKTVDELKELSNTFTSIYNASKVGLTNIDTKELNKIIAKIEKAKKAHGKGPDYTK